MIFTTESPLTNPERYAIWSARYSQYKTTRDERISRMFRELQPSFWREFLTSLAALVCMGLIIAAIVLIAEWVMS